jgi:hypothetical protein
LLTMGRLYWVEKVTMVSFNGWIFRQLSLINSQSRAYLLLKQRFVNDYK